MRTSFPRLTEDNPTQLTGCRRNRRACHDLSRDNRSGLDNNHLQIWKDHFLRYFELTSLTQCLECEKKNLNMESSSSWNIGGYDVICHVESTQLDFLCFLFPHLYPDFVILCPLCSSININVKVKPCSGPNFETILFHFLAAMSWWFSKCKKPKCRSLFPLRWSMVGSTTR